MPQAAGQLERKAMHFFRCLPEINDASLGKMGLPYMNPMIETFMLSVLSLAAHEGLSDKQLLC